MEFAYVNNPSGEIGGVATLTGFETEAAISLLCGKLRPSRGKRRQNGAPTNRT